MRKIFAVLKARNLEFIRDKGVLAWSFIFPIFLIVGISLAFQGERPIFQIAVHGATQSEAHNLLDYPNIQWIEVDDIERAKIKLEQHQYHLLIDYDQQPNYWVNTLSSEGQFLDNLMASDSSLVRHELASKKLRYVDWLLPGILAINMMYGALYGVGFVIVRYRKNGYLKRLQATPLSALEFMSAQLISRLIISQVVFSILLGGCYLILRPDLYGNIALVFVISLLGAFALSGLGLLMCSRVTSEELSRGLLEMSAWPMLLLTEAWFSLDQAHPVLQAISKVLPLTYMIDGWRNIMFYGASFSDLKVHIIFLVSFGLISLVLGASLFKWHETR